jgi:DNA-binding NarL/FixJ family response regulator
MPVRILIADDNSQVRTAMREVLEIAGGWEIIEAGDGEEAVARALEFQPGLIILDLAMPAKDGLTASREISEFLPETPILMHTLYDSPQIHVEAAKSRVRKVVPKSETSALLSAVHELLNPSEPPAPPGDLAHTKGEAVRQRTEDRIRDLCAQILSTNNDVALQPVFSELRHLLHTHVESFRARLAGYPAISERRARNDVSSTGAVAEPAAIDPPQAGKLDSAGEAPQIANAEEDPKTPPASKAPTGS